VGPTTPKALIISAESVVTYFVCRTEPGIFQGQCLAGITIACDRQSMRAARGIALCPNSAHTYRPLVLNFFFNFLPAAYLIANFQIETIDAIERSPWLVDHIEGDIVGATRSVTTVAPAEFKIGNCALCEGARAVIKGGNTYSEGRPTPVGMTLVLHCKRKNFVSLWVLSKTRRRLPTRTERNASSLDKGFVHIGCGFSHISPHV